MTKKILLVDDDEMVLIAVADLLRSQGYTVQTAANGERALELAEVEQFDLCVLDTLMPGITGRELARSLRSIERYSKLPIIMLSARPSNDEGPEEDGKQPLVLAKPIRPERLIAMVESVLL
ncbi:MAG: response regulator [Candidatus Alcyoniella australis]|nr:response regulator [Candidatus Alcyoniella australis]